MKITMLEPAIPSRVNSESVKFAFKIEGDPDRVEVKAGVFHLGLASRSENGTWCLDRKFSHLGKRTITVQAVHNGKTEAQDFDIVIRPSDVEEDVRENIVQVAKKQLSRNPREVHKDIMERFGLGFMDDWCVGFCNLVYIEATGKSPTWGSEQFSAGSGGSEFWVPDMASGAKNRGMWIREMDPNRLDKHGEPYPTGDPETGDLIIYGDLIYTDLNFFYPHIGIITGVTSKSIETIEGNVGSPYANSSYVEKRQPSRRAQPQRSNPSARFIAGYVRLPG